MHASKLGFHCHGLGQFQEVILDNELVRGEFYNFPPDEVDQLRKTLIDSDIAISIHSPLIKPEWYPDPPTWSFLCDVSQDNRNLTLKMISHSLSHAEEIGAEYIIVHFPIPSTDGDGESESKLESIAHKSCDQLAELSFKKNMTIHIEGLGNSPYLNSGFLLRVLQEYPLKYCFDTGHMNLASKTIGFDLYEFAESIAPFVGSIHLWNNRGVDDYLAYRHIPVHPSQDSQEGWVDMERLIEILNPSYPVILESPPIYPESLGNYDYRDGIQWIKEMLQISY